MFVRFDSLVVKLFWLTVACCVSAGLTSCRLPPLKDSSHRIEPAFPDLYRELSNGVKEKKPSAIDKDKVTVAVAGMSLSEFVRFLARAYSISVVMTEGLDDKLVTLDAHDLSIQTVLSMAARRAGVSVCKLGTVYYLGEVRPEDRAVYVRRCRRLTAEELQGALNGVLSTNGSVQAYADGLVVVADRAEVLSRVEEVIEAIESAESVTWCVQLYMVSATHQGLTDVGFDLVPAVKIGATLAGASSSLGTTALLAAGSQTGAQLDASLNAMLQASNDQHQIRVLAQPLLMSVDGVESKIQVGGRYPIAKSAVTGLGTVSNTGFTTVNTGLTVECQVREISETVGRMVLHVETNDIESITPQGAPVTKVESADVTVDVVSGGVYLLAALEREETSSQIAALLKLGKKWGEGKRVMLIFGRAYRVAFDPQGLRKDRNDGNVMESDPAGFDLSGRGGRDADPQHQRGSVAGSAGQTGIE
jgi:type II secretory pathway component GspD/PulD (secretin)